MPRKVVYTLGDFVAERESFFGLLTVQCGVGAGPVTLITGFGVGGSVAALLDPPYELITGFGVGGSVAALLDPPYELITGFGVGGSVAGLLGPPYELSVSKTLSQSVRYRFRPRPRSDNTTANGLGTSAAEH